MHRKFFTYQACTSQKKKGGKRYRRPTPIRMSILSPWWPCPRGVQSSSRSAVSATWRHRLRPYATISANIATSAQFGGEIHIAIQETGKGVTFGGIKQGGVELLLPPQQIRARHGWGNLLSHTSQSRGPVTAARVDAVPGGRAAQRRLEGKVGPGVGGREIS